MNENDIEVVIGRLNSLPVDLGNVEANIAQTKIAIDGANETLEEAELNAVLTAVIDGSNDKARETQRKAAIANSEEVKTARKALATLQVKQAGLEVDATRLRREYGAAMAMADLYAARLNLMAARTVKQVKFNSHKEVA